MTATLAAVSNASWPGGYVTIALVVLLAAVLFITRPEAPAAIEKHALRPLGGSRRRRRRRAYHRATARSACGRLASTIHARTTRVG
jgi:hypothetical protein